MKTGTLMAKIDGHARIEATITLALSEDEAAALDALVGYGIKPFLEVFYEKLGKAYLQPHEEGLISLFDAIRHGDASVAGFLRKAKDARDVFAGKKVAEEARKP